jgi:hypothetical protein
MITSQASLCSSPTIYYQHYAMRPYSESRWRVMAGQDDQLGRVRTAVHALDALDAGACTREQVATLAGRAIAMQGEILRSAVELDEPAWPTTREEADVLDERARLTREIDLRDAAGGEPPPEEDRV